MRAHPVKVASLTASLALGPLADMRPEAFGCKPTSGCNIVREPCGGAVPEGRRLARGASIRLAAEGRPGCPGLPRLRP